MKQPDTIEGPFISPAKFAEYFDVKPATVRKWIKDKIIKAVKLDSNDWRIPESELQRLVNEKYGEQ